MLGQSEVIACVGTTQPERAKAFYGEVLGLRLIQDEWWAIVFDVGGRRLHIEKAREKFTPVPFTALGWHVPNIEELVDKLASKGITFERPPGLQLDNKGIWISPDGVAKVCWFKDPDGNLLSLSQFP
jgi:catechol 2,3-dioxygenase-like lactoylglutathione lyase family enzyme